MQKWTLKCCILSESPQILFNCSRCPTLGAMQKEDEDMMPQAMSKRPLQRSNQGLALLDPMGVKMSDAILENLRPLAEVLG